MAEDKRQNEIIRIQKKRNNFVMLDKGFLEDERLSYKAKGILAYLLSKPDNWKVIVKDLINHSKDGKKAVYSGLRELKEIGYYKKIPVRDEKGQRISHWESVIFEVPEEQPEQPEAQAENSLLTQKGEVDQNAVNSMFPLLTPFVHIYNVQIQNEDIQNGERNKNYITNNEFDLKSNLIQSNLLEESRELKTDRIRADESFTQSEADRKGQKNIESLNATVARDKHFKQLSIVKYDFNTVEQEIKELIDYEYMVKVKYIEILQDMGLYK